MNVQNETCKKSTREAENDTKLKHETNKMPHVPSVSSLTDRATSAAPASLKAISSRRTILFWDGGMHNSKASETASHAARVSLLAPDDTDSIVWSIKASACTSFAQSCQRLAGGGVEGQERGGGGDGRGVRGEIPNNIFSNTVRPNRQLDK